MSRNPSTSAAHAFKVTREDIESLRYLNNARKAALYLGIPEVQVEDVWAEMPSGVIRADSNPGRDESSGAMAYSMFRQDAQNGSELLRETILRSMLRWADSNGTTIDEAAGFLLSGRALREAA